MQEKRVFLTRTHPRKHAQEAIFPVIYSVFLHISNTDFDPQKSANHRAPPHPPHGYRRKNVSAFPTLSITKGKKTWKVCEASRYSILRIYFGLAFVSGDMAGNAVG